MSRNRQTSNKGTSTNKGRGRGRFSSKPKNNKKDELDSETNDPNWYAADASLIRDVASFPFSRPTGTPVGYDYTFNSDDSSPIDNGFVKASVPGIYKLTLQQSCGLSQSATSAVNVAAQAMYSYVRHANSGHSNYELCDLMIYMLANSNIYALINYLQRIYGTALMYSQRNRWVPKMLLLSDGIDFNDIITNLANFRYGINLLVNKAAALAVPSDFTLFNRHAFLYQNYYIEGESVKDQIYYFTPHCFFKFGLNPNDQSGQLEPAETLGGVAFSARSSSSPLTSAQLLAYANALLDTILEQEDFGIMSGDILKAYGERIIKLASISEDYVLTFLKDDAVLLQMKNATPLINSGVTLLNTNIYQNNGVIIYEPICRCGTQTKTDAMMDIMIQPKPLTSNHTDVGNEEVIESSRLMMGLQPNAILATDPLIIHGSEIVVNAKIYRIYFPGYGNNASLQEYECNYIQFIVNSVAGWKAELVRSVMIAPFRFHNACFAIHVTTDTGTGLTKWFGPGPNFDFDNYTMLSSDEIERMHDACLFNMLHVPSVAKANAK